jgi:hypothetical protein
MAEPPEGSLSGKGLRKMTYVITCGMCGQSWQRATAHDGQAIGCMFCGYQGHLRLGLAPPESSARSHCRMEAWLHAAGAGER